MHEGYIETYCTLYMLSGKRRSQPAGNWAAPVISSKYSWINWNIIANTFTAVKWKYEAAYGINTTSRLDSPSELDLRTVRWVTRVQSSSGWLWTTRGQGRLQNNPTKSHHLINLLRPANMPSRNLQQTRSNVSLWRRSRPAEQQKLSIYSLLRKTFWTCEMFNFHHQTVAWIGSACFEQGRSKLSLSELLCRQRHEMIL